MTQNIFHNVAPYKFLTISCHERGSDYAIEPHTHDNDQLYAVLDGVVDSEVEGKLYRLHAGESMLVRPHARRDRRSASDRVRYFVVTFAAPALTRFHEPAYHHVLPLPDELEPDYTALAEEVRRPAGPDTEFYVCALFTRLMIGLCRQWAQEGEAAAALPLRGQRNADLVRMADLYMERNLQMPITRADVAEAVHLSPPHLARLFKSVTGKTLRQRLIDLRIARAQSLLRGSSLPVTVIALEVGFDSFSHFTQLFKKRVGMTPSAYRQREASEIADS